jgi:hypothetical protein
MVGDTEVSSEDGFRADGGWPTFSHLIFEKVGYSALAGDPFMRGMSGVFDVS